MRAGYRQSWGRSDSLVTYPQDAAGQDKDAFTLALRHAANPPEWIRPVYRSGPAAFDAWAGALATGKAGRDGHAYNAAVWHECRAMAVGFLRGARERLRGRCDAAFEEATGHYTTVRDRLAELVRLHPMRDDADWQTAISSPEGAALVREAGAAERLGLECLGRIASAL